MIRIKVFKWTQLIYYVVVIVLAVLIIGLAVNAISRASAPKKDVPTSHVVNVEIVQVAQGAAAPAQPGQAASRTDTQRPVAEDYPAAQPEQAPQAALPDMLFVPMGGSISRHDSAARTTFITPFEGGEEPDEIAPPHIQIEIESIREEHAQQDYQPAEVTGEGWRVAIYHTHSREAFEQDQQNPYVETEKWRTADTNFNILRVGASAVEKLNTMGIATAQDRTDHEPPRHGTAYIRSLETAKRLVADNKPMQMLIDMHRDAYIEGEARAVEVNGQMMAPIGFVIGTGEGSNGNTFSQKPNWQQNYKLALALTDQINAIAPGLCKPPSVRTGRYNQHVADFAVLVEMGHNLNTLDEVLRSSDVLAQAIKNILMP